MLITLKMLLRTLVLPPAGLVILAALGAMLLLVRARSARRAGWGLLVASLAVLWLLSTPVVADWLQRAVQRYPPLDLSQPLKADAIVILGGGDVRMRAPEYAGPAAGRGLLERLSYGAYLARKTHLPVVVSGNAHEALAMQATLMRDYGIEVSWADARSRDTFQNAQFSAQLLAANKLHRILLVTSAAHEWRAAQEFRSAGLEVVAAPTEVWAPRIEPRFGFVANVYELQRSTEALYELLGDAVRQFLAATHLRSQE
jgi:uncharacterized SAM-binding protein YcdF (DUF218 family)